jgi:hypothetical protein
MRPNTLGLSATDVARIQAHAELTTPDHQPAALNDLSVPYRVAACMPGREGYFSGELLGSWAGRTLLYWPIRAGREMEEWKARRAAAD